jgi:cation transport ATPase
MSLIPGLCSGILVTGTVVLEALAQCGTAAFDKTGTLTTGRLAATSMRAPAGTAHLEDAQNGVHCSACAITFSNASFPELEASLCEGRVACERSSRAEGIL